MGSLALKALGLTVGFFFAFTGTIKLTPRVVPDLYRQLRTDFVSYAKAFPGQQLHGYKPSPHTYRKAVGITEVVCGLTLMFIPGFLKLLANVVLLLLMVGAFYMHVALDDGLDKLAGPLVFGLLLICRLVIWRQMRGAELHQQQLDGSKKQQ